VQVAAVRGNVAAVRFPESVYDDAPLDVITMRDAAVFLAKQDEHARTLKMVGKLPENVIKLNTWSERDAKIIEIINTIKSGKEPEGMER
jgi:hypothetical protein